LKGEAQWYCSISFYWRAPWPSFRLILKTLLIILVGYSSCL